MFVAKEAYSCEVKPFDSRWSSTTRLIWRARNDESIYCKKKLCKFKNKTKQKTLHVLALFSSRSCCKLIHILFSSEVTALTLWKCQMRCLVAACALFIINNENVCNTESIINRHSTDILALCQHLLFNFPKTVLYVHFNRFLFFYYYYFPSGYMNGQDLVCQSYD